MSYKFTTFISKKKAESIIDTDGADRRIIISIRSPLDERYPHYQHPNLNRESWLDIYPVEFHDADPTGRSGMSLPEGFTPKLFTEADVRGIFEFLKKYETVAEFAYVHCDAGISRSGAVSKFISVIYGLQYPENYSLYNRHVFSTLMRVYGEAVYGDGILPPEKLPGFGEKA